jgi:hypothetical protein
MLPGYAFIKTHKVGGTTVSRMLHRTLNETQNATRCDDENHSVRFVLKPSPGCRACLTHASFRQIANALRAPNLHTSRTAVSKVCPFWTTAQPLHTMIMIREPVDHVYSRYHYEQSEGWCRRKAANMGFRGCASDHLPFLEWAFASPTRLTGHRLFRNPQYAIFAETVVTLGGKGGVREALRVLDKIGVVGLTHRFNDTLRALSSSWGLPLHVLQKHCVHANRGKPRSPLNASVASAMRAQSYWLQQEQVLYNYASRRLTKQVQELEWGGGGQNSGPPAKRFRRF